MIVAHVPTERGKIKWEDIIKSEEDYDNLVASGMAYVYFPDIPTLDRFKEYLNNKEKEVVTD